MFLPLSAAGFPLTAAQSLIDHEPVVYSQNLVWHLFAGEAVRTEIPVHPPDEHAKNIH